MTTKTANLLKMPSFSYRGLDIPALRIPSTLIDDLETNKQAYELALKSSPLAWRIGLYMVGRDLSLGIEDADSLPTPVKEAGNKVYARCQERKGEGTWHKDGVITEQGMTIKGSLRPGKDYVAAKYFSGIKGFKKNGDVWDIDPMPHTKEGKLWLPPGGGNFIVPARHEMYNEFGVPEETEADRSVAIKKLASAFDIREEQAEKELSRFYRMNSPGIAAVGSWSNGRNGPLCVSLSNEPRGRDTNIGSFPASRTAERSEALKNSGFRMVTVAEYKILKTKAKLLEEIEAKLQVPNSF